MNRILSALKWVGSIFDNQATLLSAMGYESEKDARVECVLILKSDGKWAVYVPIPGKYWNFLWMDYCILVNASNLSDMKKDGQRFFINIWGSKGHDFLTDFAGAIKIMVIRDGKKFTFV